MIKEDFLMQHAYHQVDSYCDQRKTYNMMRLILRFYKLMQKGVDEGVPLQKIIELPSKTEITRMRLQPADKFEGFTEDLFGRLNQQFKPLLGK